MFEIGNIIFIIELLIGQSIFLYACPKRKYYLLKLVASIIGCIALAYFFPMPKNLQRETYQLYQLLRFFVLLSYTNIVAAVCYKISVRTVISLCVAGYALQHIAYQTTMLCAHIPVLCKYNLSIFNIVSLFEIIVFACVYMVAWALLGKKIEQNRYYQNSDIRFDVLAVAIIFICVVLTRVSYIFSGFNALAPRIVKGASNAHHCL